MQLSKIKELIELGFSSYKIAEMLNVPRSTLSDFLKRNNLKTHPTIKKKKHHCKTCGEVNPNNFYPRLKESCKKCHDKKVKLKREKVRQAGITFLGGKCSICGYNKSNSALDFHHTDPTMKDKNFHSSSGWSEKRLLKELETCVLLCANCHRELHNN